MKLQALSPWKADAASLGEYVPNIKRNAGI